MNTTEKSHALSAKPAAAASASGKSDPRADSRQLFSTKLTDDLESTPASFAVPLSPFGSWVETKVLTPGRESFRRVDTGLRSLFGARRQLSTEASDGLHRRLDEEFASEPPDLDLQEKEKTRTSTTTPKSPKPGSASPFSVAHEEPVVQPSAADPSEPPKSSAVPQSDQLQPRPTNQSSNTVEPSVLLSTSQPLQTDPSAANALFYSENQSTQSTQSTLNQQTTARNIPLRVAAAVPPGRSNETNKNKTQTHNPNIQTQSTQSKPTSNQVLKTHAAAIFFSGTAAETITVGTSCGLECYDAHRVNITDKPIKNPTKAAFGGWWHSSSKLSMPWTSINHCGSIPDLYPKSSA